MLGQTPPVSGVCALTARLNVKICGKDPPTHPYERTMQKDFAYLPGLGCYAETVCLFTRFGVIHGNFLPNKELCRLSH